jgi:hypothetical protein
MDMTQADVVSALEGYSSDWPVVVEVPTLDNTGGHVLVPVRGIDALTLAVAPNGDPAVRGYIRLRGL